MIHVPPVVEAARGSGQSLPTGVCLLTGEFPPDPGGVGDYSARLGAALASLGVPVGVLTRRRAGRAARRWYQGSPTDPFVPVHGLVPAWDARAGPIVLHALRQLGPRPLLHIQFQAGAFDLGGWVHLLPALLRRLVPRARIITTFHDFLIPYLFPRAGPLRLAANRLLARSSHAAIFTDLGDLLAAGPAVSGTVIPIGSNLDPDPAPQVPREDVRRLLGASTGDFLVGYFGFLNASKGVPTLLDAVARLASTLPIRLALIGAEAGTSDPTDLGQARLVHGALEQLGLTERIARTGFLPPRDISAALRACDVICLPFRDGASARRGTLMAALAHGLPIVSTQPLRSPSGAAFDDVIWLGSGPGAVALRDGESILLVPPGDSPALATALARLASNPGLRVHLAAGAHALAPAISWPSIAERTLRVYQETFTSPRVACTRDADAGGRS
ncbi:MAG: glycosyltransferase [Chloroflexi bacterium]|nr:glycosyltransferase [Chloroflexota bacterium]